MTPSAPRSITYSVARSEANAGAAVFRAQQGMTGAVVQAGHTVAARHTHLSGISRAAANAPETFMPLTSRHGYGMSVQVTGYPNPLTPHNAQELIIDASVSPYTRANNPLPFTPAAHQAAGAEVRWRLQGTGFDQREVDLKRASGYFDEAAAINSCPAVQARRAAMSTPISTPAPPVQATSTSAVASAVEGPEVTALAKQEARVVASETSLFARQGGYFGLAIKALWALNIYFAYDSYQEGKHATTTLPGGPTVSIGSEGEGILNAAGMLAGGIPAGTALREAGQIGSMIHDPGRLWDAMTSGASPVSVGMGAAFGAFR